MIYQNHVKKKMRGVRTAIVLVGVFLAGLTGMTGIMTAISLGIPGIIFGLFFGGICYLSIRFLIIMPLKTGYRAFLKRVSELGDPEAVFERVNDTPNDPIALRGGAGQEFRVGGVYIADAQNVQRTSDMVWAYIQNTTNTQRAAGITLAANQEQRVILRFLNNSTIGAKVKSEEDGRLLLQKVRQYCPNAAYGYSLQLEKLYQQNPAAIRAALETQKTSWT